MSKLDALYKEATLLARALKRRERRLVLAESCTGGQAAGALASVPGISEWFCGSLVTYRDDSKIRWLAVCRRKLARRGAVQAAVAREMVEGALKRTPEAHIAGAITGHLGPNAPKDQDGLIYVAVGWRTSSGVRVQVEESRLRRGTRQKRQLQASLALLRMVRSMLTT
jgi:PncC family amidohydrolase